MDYRRGDQSIRRLELKSRLLWRDRRLRIEVKLSKVIAGWSDSRSRSLIDGSRSSFSLQGWRRLCLIDMREVVHLKQTDTAFQSGRVSG